MKEEVKARMLDSFGSMPGDENIEKRVVISRYDEDFLNPRDDWDHVFKMYSYIPRDLGRDNNAHDPFRENDDGVMELEEGCVAFFGSAYIHSGISLSLSDGSEFPDSRWDVSRNCFVMYTNKEMYEAMCGKEKWNPDDADFKNHLFDIAKGEVEELQRSFDGEWYKWDLQIRNRCHEKLEITSNGKTEIIERDYDEWENTDGCSGYLVERLSDIDTPFGVPVFIDGSAKYLK